MHEVGGGIAQCRRSLISTIALLADCGNSLADTKGCVHVCM